MEFLVWLGTFLLMFLSFFMIVLILLQRGRGGGLAGAFGGMGSQSAFGTKAGDTFTRITVVVAIIWVVLAGGVGMAMRKVQGGKSQGAGLASGTTKLEPGDTGGQKPSLGEGTSAPGGSKPEISIPALPEGEPKGSGPVLPKTGPVAPAKTDDATKSEASKPDAPKSEPAKPAEGDAAKPEAPKPEAPKGEAPKDEPKADPAKAEAPKAPKAAESKDAPKPEAKPEEPKADAEKPAEADKK